MQKFVVRIIFFLMINFGALYIGNILQGEGPFSEWYQELNIASWTPPGWFFGLAWTTIMICFSVYLALLVDKIKWQQLLPVFAIQFVLNVSWNPVFFRHHQVLPALIILFGLTAVVATIAWMFIKPMKWTSLLLAPYLVWLLVAASLNAYVLLYN